MWRAGLHCSTGTAATEAGKDREAYKGSSVL